MMSLFEKTRDHSTVVFIATLGEGDGFNYFNLMSSNQRSFLRSLGGQGTSPRIPPERVVSTSPEMLQSRLGQSLGGHNSDSAEESLMFRTLHGSGGPSIQRKASGQRTDRLFVTGEAGDLRGLLVQAQKLQARLRRTKRVSNDELRRILINLDTASEKEEEPARSDGTTTTTTTRGDSDSDSDDSDPLLRVIRLYIKTSSIQFKQSFFDHVVQTLQSLRRTDRRSTKCLFCISPVLQMWASVEHNDSLDSMQRIQASMGSESFDDDLAEDESVLVHFRSTIKKKKNLGRHLPNSVSSPP